MVGSFPAKFFERKSGIFENLQKQTSWKITAMNRNHEHRPLRMFKDQMGTSLAAFSIALPLQKAQQLGGLRHLFQS